MYTLFRNFHPTNDVSSQGRLFRFWNKLKMTIIRKSYKICDFVFVPKLNTIIRFLASTKLSANIRRRRCPLISFFSFPRFLDGATSGKSFITRFSRLVQSQVSMRWKPACSLNAGFESRAGELDQLWKNEEEKFNQQHEKDKLSRLHPVN